MEPKIIYVEFGPDHPPLAWLLGQELDAEDRERRTELNRWVAQLVERRRRLRALPHGRAAVFTNGRRHEVMLFVEHLLPVTFHGIRLTLTTMLAGTGVHDGWTARAGAEIAGVLRSHEHAVEVDPDWIANLLEQGWRRGRPGLRGFLNRLLSRWRPPVTVLELTTAGPGGTS